MIENKLKFLEELNPCEWKVVGVLGTKRKHLIVLNINSGKA